MKVKSLLKDGDGWEAVSREEVFDGDHLGVVVEETNTPSSEKARRWTVAYRKAGVVIAPLTVDKRLVLIRQERIPIRAALWEVPGGQIDDEGELDQATIEATALRELREETGYELGRDGELIPLGDFFSSPGFTDEHSYHFLARGVEPGAAGAAVHHESESILECRLFSLNEIAAMIARSEIRDANTLGICAKLVARGLITLA